MNRIVVASLFGLPAVLAAAAAGPLRLGANLPADSTSSACCAGSPSISDQHTLTLEGANQAVAAALDKARERSAGGAIAVVDSGGHLLAFQRLDGTFAAGATVSIGKARTAALFKKPTRTFEEALNGGRTALAAIAEMTPLQGGIPIVHEGQVVGAIGVSGAHSQQEDEEIAVAGAAAIAAPPTAAK